MQLNNYTFTNDLGICVGLNMHVIMRVQINKSLTDFYKNAGWFSRVDKQLTDTSRHVNNFSRKRK